ncbi:DEAD/DEAH box helicase [Metabacillus fastidiosus]|uniref:DEAD/DEAH box helicase n=1 Tax=Metabacillus fastidiosus TaxID=1458 RepID=A0ABU6NVJ5_9BACI|nr:DEAD/DEAH box helicase [Metabacillus fastidiosus]MED4400254.1 DEAD/DEAH box helicase [Metabacillus fastidiosus]
MAHMIYHSKGIDFKVNTMKEALMKDECMVCSNNHELRFSFKIADRKGVEKTVHRTTNPLSWHYLIRNEKRNLLENEAVLALKDWGIDVELTSVPKVQEALNAKFKKYMWDKKSIEAVRHTPQYKRAYELVEKKYGGKLSDGKELHPYQKEGAAYLIAKKRLLLAFDMGLGKTLCSLVGTTADPSNKSILIITMSRNMNDWVREIKVLGLEDDYIILNNPTDLKSAKRIHLVSYEKWARDSIVFSKKSHANCPGCNSTLNFHSNLQYCKNCKEKAKPLEEAYSYDDLPEKCPCCNEEWKKKGLYCVCGFSVVKQRKKSLSSHFHTGYDACIVDEGHYLKNGSSKRSKSVVRKVRTKVRCILTGTPAENGSEDLFWQLAWLTSCGSHFEDPYYRTPFLGYGKKGEEHFRMFYGGGHKRTLLEVDNIKARISNHESLWELLDSLMIRKMKQDSDVKSVINVPRPKHIRRHLDLTEADRELYDTVLQQFQQWYEDELLKKEAALDRGEKYNISSVTVFSWLTKLRQAASCPWVFDEYDASRNEQPTKIRYLIEKAKSYLRLGKKMLIFTSHKATAEQLGLILDGILPGKEAAYIHGTVDMKYRFDLMDRFQNPNDNLSILVMTTRTGAESYTLTEAKAVFLYDLDFNAKKIEQCYSRAVRMGQKSVVDILWLIAEGTIDVNMHGLVLSKQSGVDLAIDREELDFNEIAKEFEGDDSLEMDGMDYVAFAADMLNRGTKRDEVFAVS